MASPMAKSCTLTENTNLVDYQNFLLCIVKEIKVTKCENRKSELLKSFVAKIRGTNFQLFYECVPKTFLPPVLEELLEEVIAFAMPSEFADHGHFLFEREDFVTYSERIEIVLNLLHLILDVCCQRGVRETTALDNSMPYLVVILSSNIRQSLWWKESVHKLTLLILNQLRILYKVDSFSELLLLDLSSKVQSPKSSLLGQYLNVVKGRLTKDKWHANPTIVESFCWNLTQMMKFPNLSEHLDSVLPPSLMFIDSHVTEHKVKGIQCLHHIASNTTNEELRWHGRVEVMFAALKQQLYSREPDIIKVLYPALLTILPIIDKDPANPAPFTHYRQMDEVFSILIKNAIIENGIVLRRIYSQCITDYIAPLGICVVRHANQLVQLVSDYLEVYDGPEEISRLNTLHLLELLLQIAWPRMKCHADIMLKSLFKLIQDIHFDKTTTPEHVQQKLLDRTKTCLILLKELIPETEQCLKNITCSKELQYISDIVHKTVSS